MYFGNFLDDGKPQAATFRPAIDPPMEAFKYMLPFFWRDAWPVVLNAQRSALRYADVTWLPQGQ